MKLAKRKAAELEGFEKSEHERFKSSQQDIETGTRVISMFLDDCRKIKDADIAPALEAVRMKYESQMNNPFIIEMLKEG